MMVIEEDPPVCTCERLQENPDVIRVFDPECPTHGEEEDDEDD